MIKHFKTVILLLLALVMFSTGCAKLMGNLRRDLDDETADAGPTTGGRWTEAGYLSEDMSGPGDDRFVDNGSSGRNPASEGGSPEQGESWMDGRTASSARAADERQLAFSTNPNVAPPTRRMYKNGNRATRADFIDEGTNEGSLWASDGQTNYYFTKNKIRGVGDIVSLTVEPELLKDIAAEVGRTLSVTDKERELAIAQDRIDGKNFAAADPKTDKVVTSAAAPGIEEPKKEEKKPQERREATWADVDLLTAIEMKAGDIMMAEIVKRYPNGNYKLRGSKKVRYRNSYRYVNILGIAKGTDITEADTIASGKLYEYRLEAVR